MLIITKAKITQKTFQKRINTLINVIDESGNAAAKYVTSKITEQEYIEKRKLIMLNAYKSLFKSDIYEK